MFLKETLRMRPPVSTPGSAGRVVMADNAVLGGYMIPKGTFVSPSIPALHYDETYGAEAQRIVVKRTLTPSVSDLCAAGGRSPSPSTLHASPVRMPGRRSGPFQRVRELGTMLTHSRLVTQLTPHALSVCTIASRAISMGKKFAMTEMLTVLAMLLQKFELKLVSPDYQWQFRQSPITLRPLDGMPLRLGLRRALPTA
jgi:cytochrome P450